MSSSQTMTASAVGHRPPDAAPNMSSVYDYVPSPQHPDDQPHPSPPSDSAIRALHDSAPVSSSSSSPPNGLPSLSSAMPLVKSEPDDHDPPQALSTAHGSQSDLRRQSAASALLAQLLGNQSAADGPGPEDRPMLHSQDGSEHPQNNGDEMEAQWRLDSTSEPPALPADSMNGGLDQFPPESTDPLAPPPQQGKETPDHEFDMSFVNPEHDDNMAFKTTDAIDGLTDPLMFSKSNLDHADLFSSFDITAAPKTPFEALQQNEMLTAAYLSQNADLSALGYSGGHLPHDIAGSAAGSEPRIQAFAKLEFDDGHFYCNTYSFVLGRDVRAARAAHQREIQARQVMRTSRAKSSSGGNTSHTPVRVKHEGSGILGSVVSDRGGIMGFDPDVPPHLAHHLSRRSSVSSHPESSAPLHATPAQLQSTTDYNALAMQSLNDENGDAKPVDALALLPSPDSCPTIPIHPPATVDGSAAGHRGISRKHVKIAYNFDKNLFEMEVMGRNGAFIGADWLSPGQIGGVRIRFLLPDVPIGETGADRAEEPYTAEDENAQASVSVENDVDAQKHGPDGSENKETPKTTKIILKTRDPDSTRPVPSVEAIGDGSQQPVRRRGPGRPPKDGIMSK
ncbi:hypothetical protein BO71DRAFT_469736, partial [Aspergillus ellipticus CBS 707.79]